MLVSPSKYLVHQSTKRKQKKHQTNFNLSLSSSSTTTRAARVSKGMQYIPKSRALRLGVGSAVVATGSWYAVDNDIKDEMVRTGRTLFFTAKIGIDYKYSLLNKEKGTDDYKNTLMEVNMRTAQNLFYVFHRNGGLYTKIGQFISTLNHALPPEMINILKPLTDKAKPMPPELALKTLHEEMKSKFPNLSPFDINKIEESRRSFGSNGNAATDGNKAPGMQRETGVIDLFPDVFVEFDREPIAAASLAQVHRAKTADGEEVAVKIQYPYLRTQIELDLWLMGKIARLMTWGFEIDFTWIVPEFAENSLNELNFLQEASNANRLRHMIEVSNRYQPHMVSQTGGDVYVPKIRNDLTTKRTLVMEFIHGVRVDNLSAIKDMGIDPKDIASTVCHIFSDMYFVFGFVHADPHPGNLLVRKHPNKKQESSIFTGKGKVPYQLVILDHGMYRRLDPAFRRTYCNLWKALLTRDGELGLQVSKDFGLDPISFEVFSLMFTYRSPTSSGGTGQRLTKEDRNKLRDKFKDITTNDVNEFTKGLPRDIIFVMRSTAIMRSVNLLLGGTSKDRFHVMAEAAVRGLRLTSDTKELKEGKYKHKINEPVDIETLEKDPKVTSYWGRLMTDIEIARINFTLWMIDNAWSVVDLRKRWFGKSDDIALDIPDVKRNDFKLHHKDLG